MDKPIFNTTIPAAITKTKHRKFIILLLIILLLVAEHLKFRVSFSNDILRKDPAIATECLTSLLLEQERAKRQRLEIELSKLRGRKSQRIALMFTGAPRTLTQTGVMTSHVVNVIDALSAGGRDVVDVFFHLNNGTTDGTVASRSNTEAGQETFTDTILGRLMNLTYPVEVIMHADSSCTGLDGTLADHSCCSKKWLEDNKMWVYNFLQFAYLRESYRSVKRYERDNNVTYDWFVRMRPDVACFEPMPAARSLSTQRYYLQTKERALGTNTNDYTFIVPKSLSDAFFEKQIMTAFETNCRRGVALWPAESTMFKYAPTLPYQALPFPCVHVTGPNTADCNRFTRWNQRYIPSIYDIDGSKFAKGQTFEEGCDKAVKNGYFGNQSHV